ncbi:hypothetical protein L6R52_12450 [Myxococcota bacterium]|nr:hypothetical protein [Myxococcota bacterium]
MPDRTALFAPTPHRSLAPWLVLLALAAACGTDTLPALPDRGTADGAITDATPDGDAAIDRDAAVDVDGAVLDGATSDGAVLDGATSDGAVLDGAMSDGAIFDADVVDGASPDAAPSDGATSDATTDGGSGPQDAAAQDTGPSDTGPSDTGPSDSGADAGAPAVDAGVDPARTDSDCDGVSDADELAAGTNASAADSDGDGLVDGIELGRTAAVPGTTCFFPGDADPSTTTSPLSPDTDGDGLTDDLEDRNRDGARQVSETSPSSADSDGDGLADGVEDRDRDGFIGLGETSPVDVDSDFDGLDDGIEDANGNGVWNFGETVATLADSDHDGLLDGCEDANHDGLPSPGESNPRTADTDLDGLEDADEDVNLSCTRDPTETDAASSDTDCDGLSDLAELTTRYAAGAHTSPLLADTDGDLLTDGLETGAELPLAFSTCASVIFDLDVTTRTDPTLADTDGDGRSDGCEDRDQNGRVDPAETSPLARDSDGDGLTDAAEDLDGDCTRDTNETSATLADTDGDGIGDGVEVTLGTNPRASDTDGDGLGDGLEDANQNGVVENGETSPTLADTDGDGLSDGVEDANRNGTVDPGESSPRAADTDGDGLSDSAERALGTSPTSTDSDADGIPDGAESTYGTSPTDADSDDDTISDGDELAAGTSPTNAADPGPQGASGINAICAPANLRVVAFHDDVAGDWRIATETGFGYTTLTVAGGDHAAAIDDPAQRISGLVASLAPPAAGTNAVTQAQALIARLTNGTAALGATSVTVQNNGRPITTHDGFAAVVDARVNVTLGTAISASVFRNRVLAVLAGRSLSDFTGFPAHLPGTATQYVLKLQSVVRTGAATRVVVSAALVAQATFDTANGVARQQVEDLSNGTALARAWASNATGCDPFPVTRTSRADFIWMADISGSTDNDRGTIATAAAAIFAGLQSNGVDFRMGVVPHIENRRRTGSAATAGDLRSGFTTSQATFIADLNNTGSTDGCEFGLTAVDDAIAKALPRSAAGVVDPTKLRSDAKLVVFYISDEHAQELEQNQCGLGNLGTGLTDFFAGTHEQTDPSAAQQTVINSIVQPFVDRIVLNDGIAFAQIHPLQAPRCFVDSATDEEEGYGYFEAVAATGGTFYRVCDSNPGAVLGDIINVVSGAASELVLAATPISATLKVGLTRANTTTTIEVPRSSVDGFDYDAGANTIYFHGATYRPAIGDRVTISYRVFGPPTPPVTCTPPLVLNPTLNTCECPVDCGLTGGCGTGAVCDRDPAVCACFCTADCGGTCTAGQVCDQTSCACTCAPDCGGTCTTGQVCDQATCSCSCPADCGGRCTGREICDVGTCACTCPTDCGGCPSGQICDPLQCACIAEPL